jgi:predicted metal-dependent HD superfamily phosphohydrolase
MAPVDDELRTQLQTAWRNLLLPFAVPEEAAAAAFAALVARYGEASRFYHNLCHLHDVLAVIDQLAAAGRDVTAIRLAAWFHDAVYDSRADDNEERSADLAATVLAGLGLPPALVAEVRRLVLLTKTHAPAADDADGQLLVDADLSVLGADAKRYDDYARAIRREYAWVTEDAYRAGRAQVLEQFLKRPRIFWSDAVFATRELPARHNLQRELALLRAPASDPPTQVADPP